MRRTTHALLSLALLLGVSSARADKGPESPQRYAALVGKAKTLLGATRLSPGLSRSAGLLIQRATTRGQTLYFPLAAGRRVTVFDSRRIPGGFAASSLTVRPVAPRSTSWDVQLIREDSGRSLADVSLAAKRLPNGSTLELRFKAQANQAGRGSYSVVDRAGKPIVKRGDLQTLVGLARQPQSAALDRQVQAKLGVSARYLKQLMASFAPFGL